MSQSITKRLQRALRLPALVIMLVSGVMNILALSGAIYMLQVYDRVLTSQSVPTLIALSALVAGLYIAFGMLDVLRGQALLRIGLRLDSALMPAAYDCAIDRQLAGGAPHESATAVRDVDTVRNFFAGAGPLTIVDLPWTPVFLAFVGFLSPSLGIATAVGMAVLVLLSVITDRAGRGYDRRTIEAVNGRALEIDAALRNHDLIRAMGIGPDAADRFLARHAELVESQKRSGDLVIVLGGLSKVARMMLQSAILGFGAYLAIRGELSLGAIAAASIASSRALAPVENAITGWHTLAAARDSWRRLRTALMATDAEAESIELPLPCRSVELNEVSVRWSTTGTFILAPMSLRLVAGQGLAIIGASGAGKSTLARIATGVWPTTTGSVRFDGAPFARWPAADRGRFIGYMPQHVELFHGTVAENIARLETRPDQQAIVTAAKLAGIHQFVLDLPQGYDTLLGVTGGLSAGRRQQIGLARALYGEPFLIVLDEPNANLDQDGEAALIEAIRSVRARGGIAVVVAHRRSLLTVLDTVAILDSGRLRAIGPKADILRSLAERIDDAPLQSKVKPMHAGASSRRIVS